MGDLIRDEKSGEVQGFVTEGGVTHLQRVSGNEVIVLVTEPDGSESRLAMRANKARIHVVFDGSDAPRRFSEWLVRHVSPFWVVFFAGAVASFWVAIDNYARQAMVVAFASATTAVLLFVGWLYRDDRGRWIVAIGTAAVIVAAAVFGAAMHSWFLKVGAGP